MQCMNNKIKIDYIDLVTLVSIISTVVSNSILLYMIYAIQKFYAHFQFFKVTYTYSWLKKYDWQYDNKMCIIKTYIMSS